MPDSPYADLDRPPLREADLRRALVRPGGFWTELHVVAEAGSTNADLAAAARAGAAEGRVLLAEVQRTGRGRLGRTWVSPPRAGIACSVLFRPGVADHERGWPALPPSRYGWLPLLAGVAVADVVRRLCAVEAVLKWPNDLLVGPGQDKAAGVLAETVHGAGPPAVVLGVGLNVSLRAGELPSPGATSLALVGADCTDRDPLVRALLRDLASWYARWRGAAADPQASGLRPAYRERCATLGRSVRASLPGSGQVEGEAVDVDGDGRLVVRNARGEREALAAGDVVHLR